MASKNLGNDSYIGYLHGKDKIKLLISRIASYAFLVFVTVLSLAAFYILLVNATRSNNEIAAGFSLLPSINIGTNLQSVMEETRFNIFKSMLMSFLIAGATGILTTYFSAMTAYGIYVYDFRGRNLLYKFIMVIMMIPTQVSSIGFFDMCQQLGLLNTYWPLIVPAVASPVTFFYMKQYLESTLPLEIVEAARVDGSNEFRTFNTISLPIMKPAIAVQLIFAFVASWNNLFLPNLIISKKDLYTVPIVLSFVRSDLNSQFQDLGYLYMVILLSILPVVIVYVILSKFIIKGVTLGSVKG